MGPTKPCFYKAQNKKKNQTGHPYFRFFTRNQFLNLFSLLKHNILFSLFKFKIKATSELRTDEDPRELNPEIPSKPRKFQNSPNDATKHLEHPDFDCDNPTQNLPFEPKSFSKHIL